MQQIVRVDIRPPKIGDAVEFVRCVENSKKLHHPWVQPPADKQKYTTWLKKGEQENHASLLIIHRETAGLVGVVNFSNIVRGYFENCYCGYYSFRPYDGMGLMMEGMLRAISYAFKELKLHRIEANIQPGNLRSIQFVRKIGFSHIGFSRRYLKVLGRWRDHEHWALIREDFRPDQGLFPPSG